jgi:hypothetical protein
MKLKTEMPWSKRMRRLIARKVTIEARIRAAQHQRAAVLAEMRRLLTERGAE